MLYKPEERTRDPEGELIPSESVVGFSKGREWAMLGGQMGSSSSPTDAEAKGPSSHSHGAVSESVLCVRVFYEKGRKRRKGKGF